MATSGSTDWKLTRDEIITEALELIGVLDADATPEPADVTSASRSLNVLVKSLQADPSIALRFIASQTVNTVASTPSYALTDDTLKVLSAWVRIDSVDYPLNVISRQEYDLEPNKTAEGQPLNVFIDYAPEIPLAYPLPVPDAIYALHFSNGRTVEDFDASTDDADFPVKATAMVVAGLAAALASKFQLPLSERGYFDGKYEFAKREYRAGDTNRNGREIVAPSHVV